MVQKVSARRCEAPGSSGAQFIDAAARTKWQKSDSETPPDRGTSGLDDGEERVKRHKQKAGKRRTVAERKMEKKRALDGLHQAKHAAEKSCKKRPLTYTSGK